MHACMYVRTYVRTYVCMYVHKYVYIHVYTYMLSVPLRPRYGRFSQFLGMSPNDSGLSVLARTEEWVCTKPLEALKVEGPLSFVSEASHCDSGRSSFWVPLPVLTGMAILKVRRSVLFS